MSGTYKFPAAALAIGMLAACGREPPPREDEPQTAAVTTAPAVTATLVNAAGDVVGNATLTTAGDAATMRVGAWSLAPGQHGIHIHERGTCTAPTFESAGSHLNPDGRQHGLDNPAGPHVGDLPNLVVDSNGTVDTSFAISVSLLADGSPLVAPGGTALVIHAEPDDQRTDPSGNSGDRVACGVLEGRTM